MATWGTKTFEDDTAVDWITELVEAEETRECLLASITLPEVTEASEDDDVNPIDYDTSVIAIAACEVIVALIDEPRKGLPEELKDWLTDNECDDITDLPEHAVATLQVLLDDESELVVSWKEAEDYPEWREGVDELLEIMEQLAQA